MTLRQSLKIRADLSLAVPTRLTPIKTSYLSPSVDYIPTRSSRLRAPSDSSSSSSSSSSADSPYTPEDAAPMTSRHFVPGPSRPKFSTNPSFGSISSAKSSHYSSDEEDDDHDHGAAPTSDPHGPVPVITQFPPRRKVQSASAIAQRHSRFSPVAPTYPTASAPPLRSPSFPVSKPLRPFDSISTAMGNSRSTGSVRQPEAIRSRSATVNTEASGELEMKPKAKRSNVLLEPPKNNRFANGFMVINMTQEEFKSRAW